MLIAKGFLLFYFYLSHYKKNILQSLFLVGVLFGLSSCFSKFIYTDKEINHYYKNKNYKPVFNKIQFANQQLHYAQFGDTTKPLLVLIHGAPGAWYTWMNFSDNDSLRENYHILAIDRLGYGKSNYGKPQLDIHQQICAIQYLIDMYPNKPLYLVGRSYGAPIAAALANINQKNCSHLFLYSPVLSPYKEKKYWFSGIAKSAPVKWFLPKSLNVASAEKYAHVQQMKSILNYYSGISSNVLIVSGKKDWVADSSNFRICDSLICTKSKKKILIEDAGHFLTFEYPNSMSALLYTPFNDLSETKLLALMADEKLKKKKKDKK